MAAKRLKMTVDMKSADPEPMEDVRMSPEEETTRLYFWTHQSIDGPPKLYALDTSDGSCCEIEEISKQNDQLHLLFGSAILDSKIYIIGGRPSLTHTDVYESRRVLIFDPLDKKLNPAPPMIRARSLPLVVPVEGYGRIYVFGGHPPSRPAAEEAKEEGSLFKSSAMIISPWAEYYDGAKWTMLADPPSEVLRYHRSFFGGAVFGGGHNIILWNSDVFLLYDINQSTWHFIQVPAPFGEIACHNKYVAVADDTMYWCNEHLFSFDLADTQASSRKKLHHFDPNSTNPMPFSDIMSPYVVDMGNQQLCLIWFDWLNNEDKMKVSWKNFQIQKNFSDSGLALMSSPLRHVQVDDGGMFQVAGVLRQNAGLGKQHPKRKDDNPRISNPQSLLLRLSRAMCIESYNAYAREHGRWAYVEPAEGKIYLVNNRQFLRKTLPKAEKKLEGFLEEIGLRQYLVELQKEDIDLTDLKYFVDEDFSTLNIPLGDRTRLMYALLGVKGGSEV